MEDASEYKLAHSGGLVLLAASVREWVKRWERTADGWERTANRWRSKGLFQSQRTGG